MPEHQTVGVKLQIAWQCKNRFVSPRQIIADFADAARKNSHADRYVADYGWRIRLVRSTTTTVVLGTNSNPLKMATIKIHLQNLPATSARQHYDNKRKNTDESKHAQQPPVIGAIHKRRCRLNMPCNSMVFQYA